MATNSTPTPILSIIIPLYNTERFIGQCLSSIVENEVDKKFYEVIVIDDGSTDASAQIVREFCERYPNILLYTQENRGVSVARMKGISKAEGDYIWFIDSDDYITENATRNVLSIVRQHPDIDVFVTPMYLSHEDARFNFVTPEWQESFTISGKELMRRKDFFLIGPPQFIAKRELFRDKWLFFPEGIRYEDEYFARILKYRADRFLLLQKYMYVYRQWSGSHMHSIGLDDCLDILSVYRLLDDFALQEVAKVDQPWFRNNIVSFLLEALTRSEPFIGTESFRKFYDDHIVYIRSEWRKYRRYFSLKDRLLAAILLRSPGFYSRIQNRYKSYKLANRHN